MFAENILQYDKKLIEQIQSEKKWVCFGAGRYFTEFVAKYCVMQKILPFPECCFDSREDLQGKNIMSVPIRAPHTLTERKYDATIIVISTVLPYSILALLNTRIYRGYSAIYPMSQIDCYLYYLSHEDEFREVYASLKDEKSKYNYAGYLSGILSGSCYFPLFYSPEPYWNNDVIGHLGDHTSIVYAGVYKGEQLDRALSMNPNIRVHGFEPNKKMYNALKEKYAGNEHVTLYNYGLSDKEANCTFLDSQGPSSRFFTEKNADNPEILKNEHVSVVRLQTLDNLITDKVDIIALDIEGSEPEALLGGKRIISKYHPHLGVCVYHKIEHYVQLPLLILQLNPGYELYFRHHSMAPAESVMYAIDKNAPPLFCGQM